MEKAIEKKRKKKKKKEIDKQKKKEANYFIDAIASCGVLVKDSMASAAEFFQGNYYSIKESVLTIYDNYFDENAAQSNNIRVTGNVPFFTVQSNFEKQK
ncbi:conserved protein, unknown function [Hepatocystis sp. ex Piliocolobus tephrosceles]|nr:conserved protein, unknown function [Hepatocystis sp. ex Piliocolobus tephrosceles]